MSSIQGFMSSPSRSPSRGSLDISELPSLSPYKSSSTPGSDVQAGGDSNSSQLLYELSNDLKLGNASTKRINEHNRINNSFDDLPIVSNSNRNKQSSVFKIPSQIRGLTRPSSTVQKVQ